VLTRLSICLVISYHKHAARSSGRRLCFAQVKLPLNKRTQNFHSVQHEVLELTIIELSTSELEDLRRGDWELDCPRMILRKRSSKKPATFYGAGFIKQYDDKRFIFKLYASRERNTQKWGWHETFRAGEIIPDHAYYDLVATDFKARRWVASRLLPDFGRTATGKFICEGKLFELSCQGRFPSSIQSTGNYLSLWIFSNVEIPCNTRTVKRKSVAKGRLRSKSQALNAWKFRCCGIDFLLVRESDDLLTVNASITGEEFPTYFEERLIETLQFVLGRPIPWSIMRKRTGHSVITTLSSTRAYPDKARFHPPLPPMHVTDPRTGKLTIAYHRKLFERYLKHTLGYEKKRHHLWGQLNAVYEASAGSFIDAKALALAVAIESLLGSEFPDLGRPTKKEKEVIKKAQKYIDAWDGEQEIKKRIQGSVGQLFQPRALDKMRKLAELGAITDDQWRAWKKLRDPSAHSYQSTPFTPDKFVDLVQRNEVLLYHLIFHAIGYKGPYMDFSSPDWPIKEYPPKGTPSDQ
jgi:hypothetical protein